MEIVIDIPEEEYQKIINHTEEILDESSFIEPKYLYRAVIDGTPLPKGHGDLIDRNDLLEYTDINECAYIPTINRYDIITTPTIIKSDKEAQDADSD